VCAGKPLAYSLTQRRRGAGKPSGGIALRRAGLVDRWLRRVEGLNLPPTNLVVKDVKGRF
jgi:hypothetical protein